MINFKCKWPVLFATIFLMVGCGLFATEEDNSRCNPDFACDMIVDDKWTYLGLGSETITAIAINPYDDRHILAGSLWDFSAGRQGKIFRSTDCGESWEQVWEGGRITQIVFDPQNPDIVYANPHGMIRSMDGGQSWAIIDEGLSGHLDAETTVISVAVDPDNPERIYAGTGGFGSGWLFFSDNRGEYWQPVPGMGDFNRQGDDNRLLGDGATTLAINPSKSNEIWASATRRSTLLRSADRGNTWNRVELIDVGRIVNAIKFNTKAFELYVMIGGYGLYKSSLNKIDWSEVSMPDSLKIEPVGLEFIGPKNKTPMLTTGLGVFRKSSDEHWLPENEGFPHVYARTSININGWVYVGLADRNVTKNNSTQRIGGIYVRKFE